MNNKQKRKKVRFRKVVIKLSARQKKSLDNFCRSRRTTPNKIIKKSIRPLLENYTDSIPRNDYISVNQLELFKLEE